MFRRRNSQKPSEEFYSDFKQNFPRLAPGPLSVEAIQAISDPLDLSMIHNGQRNQETAKDPHSMAKAYLLRDMSNPMEVNLDPRFFSHMQGHHLDTDWSHDANHNGPWEHTAGDFDPKMHLNGTTTPTLSMSNSVSPQNSHRPSFLDMHQNLVSGQTGAFQGQAHDLHEAYPPETFHSHFNAFSSFQENYGGPTFENLDYNQNVCDPISSGPLPEFSSARDMIPSEMQHQSDQFRFKTVLRWPTAMTKNVDDSPVTYLNKSQTYTISMVDSTPDRQASSSTKYRTSLRISFEEEQFRSNPGACWKTWKEGRGEKEAEQRGGKPFAMEYVNQDQAQTLESRSNFQVLKRHIDGFSFDWTADSSGLPQCSVQVRFNFLSTDFSHSKGVKGIAVRLCAKTEVLDDSSSFSPTKEICYCNVKLFRDHGAERKLSNDKTHVRKSMDKLDAQIAQGPRESKETKKRRRSSGGGGNERPAKPQKRRRGSSVSSGSSFGVQNGGSDDLQQKLLALQTMLHRSQLPISVFHLEGEDRNDLDAFPVHLEGEKQGTTEDESFIPPKLEQQSSSMQTRNSTEISNSQSSSPGRGRGKSRSDDEVRYQKAKFRSGVNLKNPQHLASPADEPVKVRKVEDGTTSGWFEALGVDQSYRAPSEPLNKAAACFYIKRVINGDVIDEVYHRAIYLTRRTVKDLVDAIASKCGVDPAQISKTVRVNTADVHVMVEDEMVQEMLEEQALVAELDVDHSSNYNPGDFLSLHETGEGSLDESPPYGLTLRF